MVLGAIGDHAAKTVNTLGAIPVVGTGVGAVRGPIGIVLVLIGAIGWLLSCCCAKDDKGFNAKCKKLIKEGWNQMQLGTFEFIPVLGTFVHQTLDSGSNKYGPTYFESCWVVTGQSPS